MKEVPGVIDRITGLNRLLRHKLVVFPVLPFSTFFYPFLPKHVNKIRHTEIVADRFLRSEP